MLPVEQLLAACVISPKRVRGPGGQHRNKVETAIVITHGPTGISAKASERRSQHANRKRAIFRLRLVLAVQVRSQQKLAPAPRALWQSRCRNGKVSVNPAHDDFPALLAEALDAITALDMDVKAAAEHLGCSMSQLLKLLKLEPVALAQVNHARQQRSLRPLR